MFRHIFTTFLQISVAERTLFKVEEIRKSKTGGGKGLEKFELYLPVMVSKQFFLFNEALFIFHICHIHLIHFYLNVIPIFMFM